MSEYFFGVGRGRVSSRVARKCDQIARQHGACFVSVALPGEGTRYWFAGPNLGEPFDRALRDAVIADIEAAGIKLPGWE